MGWLLCVCLLFPLCSYAVVLPIFIHDQKTPLLLRVSVEDDYIANSLEKSNLRTSTSSSLDMLPDKAAYLIRSVCPSGSGTVEIVEEHILLGKKIFSSAYAIALALDGVERRISRGEPSISMASLWKEKPSAEFIDFVAQMRTHFDGDFEFKRLSHHAKKNIVGEPTHHSRVGSAGSATGIGTLAEAEQNPEDIIIIQMKVGDMYYAGEFAGKLPLVIIEFVFLRYSSGTLTPYLIHLYNPQIPPRLGRKLLYSADSLFDKINHNSFFGYPAYCSNLYDDMNHWAPDLQPKYRVFCHTALAAAGCAAISYFAFGSPLPVVGSMILTGAAVGTHQTIIYSNSKKVEALNAVARYIAGNQTVQPFANFGKVALGDPVHLMKAGMRHKPLPVISKDGRHLLSHGLLGTTEGLRKRK